MIACGGEAVVVDPPRDIDVYLEMARRERFRIAHVIETHNHADHVSPEAAPGGRNRRDYRTDFDGARPDAIAAGDEIVIGKVRLRAIATPGHRPEHLPLEVIDTKRGESPWLLLTGDPLLVGDIARVPISPMRPSTAPRRCTARFSD